ncbi:hypothetical protein JCM1841_000685 [Sporobolomyces salmonicolor]
MESESTEGLSLPLFTGRLSADWSAHEERLRAWLSVRAIPTHAHEAAECLTLSLTGVAALTWEQQANAVQKQRWEAAVAWCRATWGGEGRKRLAAVAAVNRLNARSFRERGKRREHVRDLVGDIEMLFLQAGVVDDEARRRAYVGAFFEFPNLLARLARTTTFNQAVEQSLIWEAEMVARERESLTAHLRPRSSRVTGQGRTKSRADTMHPQNDPTQASSVPPADLDRPPYPTPADAQGGLSPVQSRFTRPPSPLHDHHHDHDHDHDSVDAYDLRNPSRRSIASFGPHLPHPPIPVSVSQLDLRRDRPSSHLPVHPRSQSALDYAQNHSHERSGYTTTCPGPRTRSGFPSFDPNELLIEHLHSRQSSFFDESGLARRTSTPAFVTEATTFDRGGGGREASDEYDRAMEHYPSRPSSTLGSDVLKDPSSPRPSKPKPSHRARLLPLRKLAKPPPAASAAASRVRPAPAPPVSPRPTSPRAHSNINPAASPTVGRPASILGNLFRRADKDKDKGKDTKSRRASSNPSQRLLTPESDDRDHERWIREVGAPSPSSTGLFPAPEEEGGQEEEGLVLGRLPKHRGGALRGLPP